MHNPNDDNSAIDDTTIIAKTENNASAYVHNNIMH